MNSYGASKQTPSTPPTGAKGLDLDRCLALIGGRGNWVIKWRVLIGLPRSCWRAN